MPDLRGPDPTLEDVGPQYVMLEPANDDGTLERAHYAPDQGDVAKCGWTFPGDLHTWLPGDLAAYIAVPCRECWPTAPPPGCSRWCCNRPPPTECRPQATFSTHLEWQVPA